MWYVRDSRFAGLRHVGAAVLGLLVGCSPGGGAGAGSGAVGPGSGDRMGELVALSPSVDFGDVFEGEVLERRFEFDVAGDGPIRIVSVRRSCGCQKAELVLAETGEPYATGTDLAPGTRLWLESSFETLGRAGDQKKTLGLYGDFKGGAMEVSLTALVRPLLEIEPDPLNLGQLISGEVAEGVVELSLAREFDQADRVWLEVGEFASKQRVDLSIEPLDPAADGSSDRFRLHVASHPDAIPGYYNHRIPLVARTEPGAEALYSSEAHVLVHVLGLAEAQPTNLSLRSLAAGQVSASTGKILVRGDLPDLTGLEPEVSIQCADEELGEYFSVEVERVEGGSAGPGVLEYALSVRTSGLPDEVRGPIRGRLVFPLGHPAQQQLVVGVHGVALGG